jgi:hypothetical protein
LETTVGDVTNYVVLYELEEMNWRKGHESYGSIRAGRDETNVKVRFLKFLEHVFLSRPSTLCSLLVRAQTSHSNSET